jgi:probable HAF family extracellular repeat protein
MRQWTRVYAFLLLVAIPSGIAQDRQSGQPGLPHYAVKDLGALGGTFSLGVGINNEGLVGGDASLRHNAALHAFLWQQGKGHKIDLGTLGGPNSEINGKPNEQGVATGLSETSNPDPLGEDFCFFGSGLICLPFVWQNDAITALPTLGGNNGIANYVNNLGQVAGLTENATLDSSCANPQYQTEPVIWEKGLPQQLPTVDGDPDGFATAINDQGLVVGGSGQCRCLFCSAGALHALLWHNGVPTDLGNLGGSLFSQAQDINAQGQVIGASDLPGDTNFFAGPFSNFHAFLWQQGALTDLGTLPGDTGSYPASINNKGQIVGQGSRAVLWDSAGNLIDLNTLVAGPPFSPLYLLVASDINDQGEIVGQGLAANGDLHAFLAVPCDERHRHFQGCDNNVGARPSEESQSSQGSSRISAGQSDAVLGLWPGTFRWHRPGTPPRAFSSLPVGGTSRRP